MHTETWLFGELRGNTPAGDLGQMILSEYSSFSPHNNLFFSVSEPPAFVAHSLHSGDAPEYVTSQKLSCRLSLPGLGEGIATGWKTRPDDQRNHPERVFFCD